MGLQGKSEGGLRWVTRLLDTDLRSIIVSRRLPTKYHNALILPYYGLHVRKTQFSWFDYANQARKLLLLSE